MMMGGTVENIARVIRAAFGRELFSDFNYVSIHKTTGDSVTRYADGSIQVRGDQYDDELCAVYRDEYGDGLACSVWRGTTQPGAGVREQPYNGTEGAGTIVPGFYQSILKLDKWGEFDALLQRDGVPYWVFRDANTDSNLDLDLSTVGKGYGFQTHRRRGSRTEIKRSFGGCQGTLHEADFEEFLRLFREKNSGEICSHYVIYSHWLQRSDELIQQDMALINQAVE